MLLRRLLFAGTAGAIALAVAVGVLLAMAGGTGGTDHKARDRAVLAAVSAGLNWQIDADSQAKAAAEAAVPTSTPIPSPIPAPTEAPPPAAAVDATPVAPPFDEPPQQDVQPPPPPPPPPVEWLDTDFSARVLERINAVRGANGVPALSVNAALTSSAGSFSNTLTQLRILDHSAGGDLLARVQANGFYDNVPIGEVLWYATGSPSPSDPVNGWINSPAHHDIILDPTYRQAGAGCFFSNASGQLEVRCVVEVAG
jgi:uncharacterized protein YkwD